MDSNLVVVGVGASAGGIRAVKEFLASVPADSGMAFVVILHLSPEHESRLAEVLRGSSAIPVMQVTERIAVAPNQVYVIPPDHSLSMVDGHLALSSRTRLEERRAPIDIFFRTLGESHHSRAVGVVLSGTGADGSMGLKRIKENGGLCFAQDPDDAEYGDMPRNSIATGIVDHVLPARDIPAKILAFNQHLDNVRVQEPPGEAAVDERALRDIFTQIRTRTGHDFSNYKRPTMMRRITRRMAVNEAAELSTYAEIVRERPAELQALLKDLLISVTHFFRDADAFDILEQRIIPQLFEGKTEDDQVRVWVAGCATGEEVYSVGILLMEHAGRLASPPAIQLFATDLDTASIAVARQGLYTINDAADVSQERLRRFFTKEGEAYRVRQDLRESVLFSQHNIIKDPPFSHLDLVTCRNLLIYLNRTAQRRVMEVVHFALSPGRFLFLGSSESVEAASDLFIPYDKDACLFQRQTAAGRLGLPVPRSRGSLTFDDLPPREPLPAAPRERLLAADLHHQLLEQYAPPSVVVNAEHEILHLSATAGRYLELGGGDPSLNILKVVRPEVRLELRSALYQAAQQRTPVEARNLPIRINGERPLVVSVIVKPVFRPTSGGSPVFLILFREEADPPRSEPESTPLAMDGTARRLDDEVGWLKAQLRAALERHDVQLEDHKAALEEQQAMYEELRSSSEELETSREELQSLNEELRTVNQELRIKVEEQTQANDDMQNLVSSSEIGTIFLDRDLKIKLFTPPVQSIFSLIPTDRGRPLSDINTVLDIESGELHRDADHVLNSLDRVERELPARDGRWLLMRMHPYRTADDRIDGVVLTFVDVTDRRAAADLVAASEARLRRATEVENVAITFFTIDGRLTHANEAFLRLAGGTAEQLERGVLRRESGTPPEWLQTVHAAHDRLRQTGRCEPYEREYLHSDGSRRWVLCAATLLAPDQGVEFMVDMTTPKRIEQQLQASDARLRLMVESVTEYAIITMDDKGRIDHWNAGAARMFGYVDEEILGQSASLMFTPEDRATGADREELREAREDGRASDERWHVRKDGSRFYTSGVTAPIYGPTGAVRGYVKVARDLTDRKQAEDSLRQAHAALEERVRERTKELATANRLLETELRERVHAETRVRELLGRMISAQEHERRRISRDLHDQVGQQVVALRLTVERLRDLPAEGTGVPQADGRGGQLVEKALEAIATLDRDIDSFAWELRPLVLDDFGIVAAIRRFVEAWSKTVSVQVDFHSDGLDEHRLSPVVETNLYRIVQEALNNIQKHARASVVSVVLDRRGDDVALVIEDDGRGFDAALDVSLESREIGLLGMQERTSLIGGELQIESAPGKGTTIYVRVPFAVARSGESDRRTQ
jgi:two-component system, chemotaxis family, CheB/CheR fusion protein